MARRHPVRLCALGVLPALLLLTAASAKASVTVGSSLRQRADLAVRCDATCTELQTARPGGTGLTIPVAGVITRWRLRAATSGTVRLRVLRPVGDGTFATVGLSEPQKLAQAHDPGQDAQYTFTARLSVQVGDQIALDHERGAAAIFHSYGQDASYAAASFRPQPAVDVPAAPAAAAIGRELLLNADIERDADGDGFGDESQDNCPAIANDQTSNPCPPGTGTGTGTGAGTGTGTGSQPVGPTPPTPVAQKVRGEPAIDRTQRGHGAAPAPRATPVVAGTGASGHGRRPAPRPAPRRARTPLSGHRSRRPARRTPVQARNPLKGHRTHPSRPAPRARRPAVHGHPRHGARPTPRARPAPQSGHGARPAPRPAPQVQPAPGFRFHRGR